MRIASPSTSWTTAVSANNKILQWKIYARKVTTVNESLTAGTTFTDVTSLIREMPAISQAIEYEAGQFTSDSFELVCSNLNYWLANFLDFTTAQQVEFKVTLNLSLTGASFTSDTPIIASGFLDKSSVQLNEFDDSVNLTIQSYDEYANRITGVNLTLQNTRSVNSATHLVLNKLPGCYLKSAAPYLTLQTLTFNWDSSNSVFQLKYNDGDYTTVSASTEDTISLRDENNNLAEVYVTPNEFEKYEFQQKFIFRNSSDTLPYVFYDDANISDMLTTIASEMPVVSSAITSPTFSPYDSGYRLTSLESITNTVGNATAKCIEWDSTNSLFFIGVGNKLYTRNTSGTWTLKATASTNYTIKRIFITTSYIYLVLSYNAIDDNYYLGVYNRSSLVLTEVDSLRLANDDKQLGYSNFFYHSTGIYYSRGGSNRQTIKYLDPSDNNLYTYANNIDANYPVQHSAFSFFSTNYGYYAIVADGATFKLYNKNGVTGNLLSENLPGVFYNAIVIDNGSTLSIYFTLTNGHIYKYAINSGGISGTVTTISTTITAYGFYKSGSSIIYFYGNGAKSGSTFYPFAYLHTSTDVITTLSNFEVRLPGNDFDIKLGSFVHATGLGINYLITPQGRFFQYHIANTNRINGEYNTSNLSVRDALNDFCKAYNLIYIVRPNKQLVLFSRATSSGQINTNGSASSLSISTVNLNNISNKFGFFGKATKVKVLSSNFDGNYNGSSYNTIDVDDEKVVEIQNDLIQHSSGLTLRDMATAFYPFYSRQLYVLNCSLNQVPAFQFEVTDGAEVDLTGTKINFGAITDESVNEIITEASVELSMENSSGIIQKQTINQDGSMEVEVLI